MEGFGKDFPKIKTSYVRAQTGALYNKILSERSAGRFDVDVLQLSDVAPAVDFEKRGGYELYIGPYMDALQEGLSQRDGRRLFLDRRDLRGPRLQQEQGHRPRTAPKTYQDINNPRWRNKISCKISSSGIQYVQWYLLRQIYGNDFWKEFAKQRPRAFDSRVQLFDRLAKGDDDMTALAEYSAYVLYKQRGADVEFVAPARGPGRDAADPRRGEQGAASGSRQAVHRLGDVAARAEILPGSPEPLLRLADATIRPPMPTGQKLSDYKLIYPKDWDDYAKTRDVFNKEWNAMLGL